MSRNSVVLATLVHSSKDISTNVDNINPGQHETSPSIQSNGVQIFKDKQLDTILDSFHPSRESIMEII